MDISKMPSRQEMIDLFMEGMVGEEEDTVAMSLALLEDMSDADLWAEFSTALGLDEAP